MGTRKRLQRVFLDCFAPVLGLPDHRRGSKTRPFCGRRIKNVCLVCVLFVCTFCVPFVVVVFRGQQDIPDVLYTMDGKFGYNPSGLSVSVPSICTERHVDIVRDRLNKKVPDSFRSTLVVTDTSPVLAVDPFLSIGFPIYHALSTDTLRAFLRCNGLPLTKVILYNLPIDRVQAIVKSSLHDRRRTVSYTVLYTDGTDVDFSEHEHTENRMLVVGNEVDRFVTTATVDAGQHARSYFSHIDPLVPSQPLFAGVKQSVVDKNIHVGVFDAHLPVQQLQTQLWAACTHGKRYVVHAFLDDKFERIRGPFEMCDNPIFWHSKTIEEPLQHMLMTAMDVHICPNAVRNGLVLSAFGQGIPVIAEEGGHVMPSKDALGKLLTYRKSSTGYEIRESLERVELAQRHHDLKQRILTFAATFNDAASGQWDEMVSVGITQSMRSMLYCAHNEGRTERNTRLLSSFGVSDWADDSTAKHHTPMSGGTVLFIASELGGISPGGAGILIRSIIMDLLVAEVHIIILFDTTDLGPWEDIHDTFDQIRLRFRRELFAEAGRAGDESSLRIIALQTVAKLDEYTFGYDESIAKSLRWAQAIETVYLMHRFDMVEVFDFTGAGSALLLRRLHGRSVLPQDVIVAVRIHGTFELISAAENAALNMVSFRRNNLERFALTMADVVLYPGAEIMREYRKSLAIVTRRDLEGVPPLLRALKKYIKNAGRLMPWKQRNILVLGKVQRIKGVFQIVEGISQLMLRHPVRTPLCRISIRGPNLAY